MFHDEGGERRSDRRDAAADEVRLEPRGVTKVDFLLRASCHGFHHPIFPEAVAASSCSWRSCRERTALLIHCAGTLSSATSWAIFTVQNLLSERPSRWASSIAASWAARL